MQLFAEGKIDAFMGFAPGTSGDAREEDRPRVDRFREGSALVAVLLLHGCRKSRLHTQAPRRDQAGAAGHAEGYRPLREPAGAGSAIHPLDKSGFDRFCRACALTAAKALLVRARSVILSSSRTRFLSDTYRPGVLDYHDCVKRHRPPWEEQMTTFNKAARVDIAYRCSDRLVARPSCLFGRPDTDDGGGDDY